MGLDFGSAGPFVVLAVFKHIPIDNFDSAGSRQLDDAAVLEVGQRAAHGFDRYCEVVGDIVARDGKSDAVSAIMRHPGVHLQNKGCDLFQCRDPPEDQELCLQSGHGLERDPTQITGESWLGIGQRFNAAAQIAGDQRVLSNCFGRVVIFIVCSEPKKVAWQ